MVLIKLLLGVAFIAAGIFLIRRRGAIFNKLDREVSGKFWRRYWGVSDPWYDIPANIKMLLFGIGFIAFGCLSIYGALVDWLER